MAELASFCENCCFLEDKKCQHGLLDTFQERNARIEWENDFPIVYRVCPYRRTKEWNIEKTDEEKQQLCRDEIYIMGTITIIANDKDKLSEALDKICKSKNIERFKIIVIYNKIPFVEVDKICKKTIKSDYKCILFFEELNLQIYRSLEYSRNGFLFIIDSNKEFREDIIDRIDNFVNKKLFRVLHVSNSGEIHESVNMMHIYKYIKGDLSYSMHHKLKDIEQEENPNESQIFSWEEVDAQYQD